jgi:hypothetical protein
MKPNKGCTYTSQMDFEQCMTNSELYPCNSKFYLNKLNCDSVVTSQRFDRYFGVALGDTTYSVIETTATSPSSFTFTISPGYNYIPLASERLMEQGEYFQLELTDGQGYPYLDTSITTLPDWEIQPLNVKLMNGGGVPMAFAITPILVPTFKVISTFHNFSQFGNYTISVSAKNRNKATVVTKSITVDVIDPVDGVYSEIFSNTKCYYGSWCGFLSSFTQGLETHYLYQLVNNNTEAVDSEFTTTLDTSKVFMNSTGNMYYNVTVINPVSSQSFIIPLVVTGESVPDTTGAGTLDANLDIFFITVPVAQSIGTVLEIKTFWTINNVGARYEW